MASARQLGLHGAWGQIQIHRRGADEAERSGTGSGLLTRSWGVRLPGGSATGDWATTGCVLGVLLRPMAFSMLPTLRPNDWRAVICVRVCRKWEYRGGTDDGPVQHVDLVLLDEQGNSLYGEIPGPEVHAKSPLIDEGGIYVIDRFRVSNAKAAYRPIDAPYMVEFTLHTTVSAARSGMPDFPKYAYKITPIDGLAVHSGDTKNFHDTIGTLVEVSDIHTVHLPNKPAPTLSRHIVLRDLSYSEIKITLWGQRATTFSTEGVYDSNEAKPIVVLFVGGLVKSFQGSYYLSGNTACHWYFNPMIPEAHQFYASFHNQRLEISKSYVPDGTGYRCIPCSNTSFKFKYKVCFIALDGTDEAEMVCFGDIARRMIGKLVQQLLRTSTSANAYPPDITKLVSPRFTFVVTMTRQSYYRAQKTYNVASLVTAHGHPVAVPANAARGNAGNKDHGHLGAAESGDSSGTSDGADTHQLLSAVAHPRAATILPLAVGFSKRVLVLTLLIQTVQAQALRLTRLRLLKRTAPLGNLLPLRRAAR
ncbi:unnamed protein product [Miscanthus lutarioriparius]|uniref:Replication protein A OB domain-containing protein n=1 Tax=Miscanthus lutarioriparius TaxID=422564 RepID=A0A811QEX9_9POAL|nr:unnamed protein product [Miscanthus lutarioriparius]